MSRQYLIRPARPGDKDTLYELMALYHVEEAAQMGTTARPDDPIVLQGLCELDNQLDNGTARCWVAVTGEDDVPVAYLFFNAGQLDSGLYARPEHRKGVGRMLIKACEEEYLGHGITEATVPVVATNRMVINLYRKHGFEIVPGSESNGVLQMTRREPGTGNHPDPSPA